MFILLVVDRVPYTLQIHTGWKHSLCTYAASYLKRAEGRSRANTLFIGGGGICTPSICKLSQIGISGPRDWKLLSISSHCRTLTHNRFCQSKDLYLQTKHCTLAKQLSQGMSLHGSHTQISWPRPVVWGDRGMRLKYVLCLLTKIVHVKSSCTDRIRFRCGPYMDRVQVVVHLQCHFPR